MCGVVQLLCAHSAVCVFSVVVVVVDIRAKVNVKLYLTS